MSWSIYIILLRYLGAMGSIEAEEVGHMCVQLIIITYFYLEFHVHLNNCNTKPVNIGVQWGLVDH